MGFMKKNMARSRHRRMGRCSLGTPATGTAKRGGMLRSLGRATAVFSRRCRSAWPRHRSCHRHATATPQQPPWRALLPVTACPAADHLLCRPRVCTQPGRVPDHSWAVCVVRIWLDWLRGRQAPIHSPEGAGRRLWHAPRLLQRDQARGFREEMEQGGYLDQLQRLHG